MLIRNRCCINYFAHLNRTVKESSATSIQAAKLSFKYTKSSLDHVSCSDMSPLYLSSAQDVGFRMGVISHGRNGYPLSPNNQTSVIVPFTNISFKPGLEQILECSWNDIFLIDKYMFVCRRCF